jgi:hypothetical protein
VLPFITSGREPFERAKSAERKSLSKIGFFLCASVTGSNPIRKRERDPVVSVAHLA